MSNLETLDMKLDNLGSEMRVQTISLSGIENNTKAMVQVALSDQEARDRIYDKLAEGLLKLAKCMSWCVVIVLALAIIATFKQEIHLNLTDKVVDIGAKNSKAEYQKK